MKQLKEMLEVYRNGERGLPSYDELAAIDYTPTWISITDRLPEFNVQVIGYSTSRKLASTCYRYKSDDKGWGSAVLYSDEITHWTPLPQAPTFAAEKNQEA